MAQEKHFICKSVRANPPVKSADSLFYYKRPAGGILFLFFAAG
jgi:hypothetical protein